MQTFVPYPDVNRCADVLDRQRLGKQRVECHQIAKAIAHRHKLPSSRPAKTPGWVNHPATIMWQHNARFLMRYYNAIRAEWLRRGYRCNMGFFPGALEHAQPPAWWGDDRVHASHRAALLHKLPDWYGRFGWSEVPALNYFWPQTEDDSI